VACFSSKYWISVCFTEALTGNYADDFDDDASDDDDDDDDNYNDSDDDSDDDDIEEEVPDNSDSSDHSVEEDIVSLVFHFLQCPARYVFIALSLLIQGQSAGIWPVENLDQAVSFAFL